MLHQDVDFFTCATRSSLGELFGAAVGEFLGRGMGEFLGVYTLQVGEFLGRWHCPVRWWLLPRII